MVTWRLSYRGNAGMRNVRGAGSESRCGVSRCCRVWHPLFRVSRSGACHVSSQLSTNHSVLPGARCVVKRLQRFYASRHIRSGLTYASLDAGFAMPSCSRCRGDEDERKERGEEVALLTRTLGLGLIGSLGGPCVPSTSSLPPFEQLSAAVLDNLSRMKLSLDDQMGDVVLDLNDNQRPSFAKRGSFRQ